MKMKGQMRNKKNNNYPMFNEQKEKKNLKEKQLNGPPYSNDLYASNVMKLDASSPNYL
jgi:hypothetical protein